MASKKKVSVESQVRDVRINLWHDGDRSVGIAGEVASVGMSVSSPEMLQASVTTLTEAFTTIWDFKALVSIEYYDDLSESHGAPLSLVSALKRYRRGW